MHFRHGFSLDDVFEATKIDRWFLIQIEDIVKTEAQVKTLGFGDLNATISVHSNVKVYLTCVLLT